MVAIASSDARLPCRVCALVQQRSADDAPCCCCCLSCNALCLLQGDGKVSTQPPLRPSKSKLALLVVLACLLPAVVLWCVGCVPSCATTAWAPLWAPSFPMQWPPADRLSSLADKEVPSRVCATCQVELGLQLPNSKLKTSACCCFAVKHLVNNEEREAKSRSKWASLSLRNTAYTC